MPNPPKSITARTRRTGPPDGAAPEPRADHRSPAAVVCALFGSAAEVARLLGLQNSTTWRWLRSGLVPSQYHTELLDHSDRIGLGLTAEDLVRGRGNAG